MAGDAVERTVAIVGDDPETRDSVATLLEVHGFGVRQYESVEAFLADRAAVASARCLVLDVSRSEVNGTDPLDRLARGRPSASDALPPAILISTNATAPVAARARAVGVHIVLDRPVPPLDLVAYVRALTD